MNPIDEKFISRVYRTTLWLGAICELVTWSYWGNSSAIGLLSGILLDLVCLRITELGVKRCVRPGSRNLRPLIPYALIMYLVLMVALFALTRSRFVEPIALAVGLGFPNLVILLKILGMNLISHLPGNNGTPSHCQSDKTAIENK